MKQPGLHEMISAPAGGAVEVWNSGVDDPAKSGQPPVLSPYLKGPVRLMLFTITLFFGVGGYFAAVLPLSQAVVVDGRIIVDGQRLSVQAGAYGRVREVFVREGQRIEVGALLISTDDTQVTSDLASTRAEIRSASAKKSRLEAELSGKGRITFDPLIFGDGVDDPDQKIEQERFVFRQKMLSSKLASLAAQIKEAEALKAAVAVQIEKLEAQIRISEERVAVLEELVEKGLSPRPPLLQASQQVLGLAAEAAGLQAQAIRNLEKITALQAAVRAEKDGFLNQAYAEASEVSLLLEKAQQRERQLLAAAAETVIRSPASGRVINLLYSKPGPVLSEGQTILELVPDEAVSTVVAKVMPTQIDSVRTGQQARFMIDGFSMPQPLELSGIVRDVSADAIFDEASGQAYFSAYVELEQSAGSQGTSMPALLPGMTGILFIECGQQTLFQYLVKPIRQIFDKALREV